MLAETYGVAPFEQINSGQLGPILEACLKSPPKGGWTAPEVQRLAEEIEYGLTLLRSTPPNHPSQDVIDLVARVVGDRWQDKPS